MRLDPWIVTWTNSLQDWTWATPAVSLRVVASRRQCIASPIDPSLVSSAPRLLGTLVTAYLSYVDGFAPLHGSCVSRDGSALSIVGRPHAGKSTLAAALVANGAQFVSDGVTIVDPDTALVRPGPPTRRLWDDALTWLGDDPANHPPLEFGPPKRVCAVPESVLVLEPPVLRKIFVVEDGEELGIERLSPHTSVMQLVRHGFLSPWIDIKEAPKLTQLSVAVANRVPVYKLMRPKRLDVLRETVELIDAQFAIESD